jgi:chromate reductase
MKKNIFIIGGSLRKESYNKFLASNLVEIGKNDFNFEIFSDFNLLPMYNTDDHSENNWPSALLEIEDKIKNADGVIFITPEYNFSVPGYLKKLY